MSKNKPIRIFIKKIDLHKPKYSYNYLLELNLRLNITRKGSHYYHLFFYNIYCSLVTNTRSKTAQNDKYIKS